MQYSIMLRRRDRVFWYYDSILPGIVPDRVIDMMVCRFVEEQLGLCAHCDAHGSRCHVIEEPSGRKLCPVLFHDAVHPPWRVCEVP